jgi:hypothetical protein
MVALQKMQLNDFGIFPVPDRSGFPDEDIVDDLG